MNEEYKNLLKKLNMDGKKINTYEELYQKVIDKLDSIDKPQFYDYEHYIEYMLELMKGHSLDELSEEKLKICNLRQTFNFPADI